MAIINLPINVPDAQQVRVIAALKINWTTTVNGVEVVPTTAQVIEKLRLAVAASIKDIVLRVERDAARTTADAGVTPVDAA